jgi:phosphate/sulfate permease
MSIAFTIAIALSTLLALNIGANNSAASMATAYGAGVRSKREAVILIAVFALMGAFLAGARVIKTLSGGLVPESVLSSHCDILHLMGKYNPHPDCDNTRNCLCRCRCWTVFACPKCEEVH